MAILRRTIRCSVALVLTLALSGCLGGDDPSSSTTSVGPAQPTGGVVKPRVPNGKDLGGENSVPVVSGSPSTQVAVAQAYAFDPSATDADDDVLTFMIQNKPDWASFDDTTGRLSGTPTSADVGVYENITISVTDGVSSAALAPFSITVAAIASGQATLSWSAPTQNTDGTPLTNLAGYKIYYGQSSSKLSKVVKVGLGVTTTVIENLAIGKWYFAMSSYNSSGVESTRTQAIGKTIEAS